MDNLIPAEIQLLLRKNYLSVYKGMIQNLGLVPACVLSFHIEKFENLVSKGHSDEWYFLKSDEQCHYLGISNHILKNAKDILLSGGFISEERKGTPSKLWYKIDFVQVLKVLEIKYTKILSTCTKELYPLNNNKNNNKNNKKSIGDLPAEESPEESETNQSPETKPSRKRNPFRTKAKRILAKLNQLTNMPRGFSEIDSNLNPIISRLKAGYSYSDCIQVIKTKTQDPYFIDNPRFFAPDTMFRPSKFEKYLNEDPTKYKRKQNTPTNGSGISGRIDYDKNKVVIKSKLNGGN